MALCLLVAACSLPGRPQAQPSSGSSRSGGVAFAQCMRSHGVPNFPDPNGSGGAAINQGSGVDPTSPQFQAAQNACKSLAPHGPGGEQLKPGKSQLLKYARCMRAHGISDFPDPSGDGSNMIQSKPGSDLSPDNPQFQAADKACKQLRPSPGSMNSQQG